MSLRLLPVALNEIRSATAYYNRRRWGLGEEFADSLSLVLASIEEHPERFAKLLGIRSPRVFRGASLDRFPYNVVYEIRPDEVVVLAVAHFNRRPDYWKRRR